MTSRTLSERIVGVFKLDVPTFEEIEHDQSATGQAAAVVAVVAVLSAIGSSLTAGMSSGGAGGNFLVTLISAFAGWLIWWEPVSSTAKRISARCFA